jgi:mannosyltransferase OCH1-like enzyme
MKSDFFRISYLSVHGGVYVDADELCLRPVWPVVRALLAGAQFVGAMSGEPVPYVHSAFLAAPPRAAMFRSALRQLIAAIEANPRPNIWDSAGPGLITRAAAQLVAEDEAGSRRVILMGPAQFQSFCSCMNLQYKFTAKGNWRLLED